MHGIVVVCPCFTSALLNYFGAFFRLQQLVLLNLLWNAHTWAYLSSEEEVPVDVVNRLDVEMQNSARVLVQYRDSWERVRRAAIAIQLVIQAISSFLYSPP